MRVHHLDCATMCPFGGRLLSGQGSLLGRTRLVGHCLLVEARRGLVLVDTGFGTREVSDPKGRLGASFVLTANPTLAPETTAIAQVRALGFSPDDVTDILVTHLDLDHAGGLVDFPKACVHLHGRELDAATNRATWIERERYRAVQWAHGPSWVRHDVTGERWNGFEAVRALDASDDEVLLVPLHGHTRGHSGVAVRGEGTWWLHGGDAFFHRKELDREPWCPPITKRYQTLLALDEDARLANQARLRALALEKRDEVRVICAHDTADFDDCVRRAKARAA